MRKLYFLVFLLNSWQDLQAQTRSHSFVEITREQGMASNDVYDIYQDHKGFYWIATDNGLQRYDGKRWVSAVLGGRGFLPGKPVWQIVEWTKNELLLKTGGGYGLFRLSDFTYTPVETVSGNYTQKESSLWKDSKNRIFRLQTDGSLLWFDPRLKAFTAQRLPVSVPRGWKISAIFEDTARCHYWFAADEGIAVFDERAGQLYQAGKNPLKLPLLGNTDLRNVTQVFIDGENRYWAVYGRGRQSYVCFDAKANKYSNEPEQLNALFKGHLDIKGFFYTAEAGLWLFGRNALICYMPEYNAMINSRTDPMSNTGAHFNVARRIIQDNEKGLWIATDAGLLFFHTAVPPVTNIILRTENDDNAITDVEEIRPGEWWFSRRGKGIRAMSSEAKRVNVSFISKGLPAKDTALLQYGLDLHYSSRKKQVWMGCEQGAVAVVDPLRKTTAILRPPSFGGAAITSISEDPGGRLWFGTAEGSLVCYDIVSPLLENSFVAVRQFNGAINSVFADKNQSVWICTREEGLYRIDGSTGKQLNHFLAKKEEGKSLSSNNVKKIVQMNDSIYAVVTDVLDLVNVASGKVRSLTFHDGLAGNTISGLEMDNEGYLWIATSNGICRYNYNRNRFTQYSDHDGFVQVETVGRSSKKLSDGRLLFTGSNFVVCFPPKAFNVPVRPPVVHITDIKLKNSFIPVDSANAGLTRISYAGNALSIYFSALSYLQKDKLTYYYRLNGLQQDWVKADQQLAAVYNLLPSGDYIFEVRCENEEGLSSPVTKFAFIIEPPFWKTWWFILLGVAALAVLLFLLYRLKVKRILAVSELRDRVARDLHDDVGSTLSTISILSTIAKNKLAEDPVQAENYINKITDNSQQMMEAMDDIVWSIKPMNDSMQKIVARMREVASSMLEPKNIDIDFYVDPRVSELRLNMESRRDFFLIFKEAVNNIAKYSTCTHVTIELAYNQNRLDLKIKDNGIGFDPGKADSGNGISNMKKRAAMLSGNIQINSAPGAGSLVLLHVPIN